MVEEDEFVKVFISFVDIGYPNNCNGETPWAKPTDKDDEFTLSNQPLHPDYGFGERVRVEMIDGRRTVVGKVE